MKCPHKHVEARFWSRHWHDWTVVKRDYHVIDALICRDCGECVSARCGRSCGD